MTRGVPRVPGVRANVPTYVYRCYDSVGTLLYIGCTNQPIQRVETHRRTSWWGDRFDHVRYTVFPNREKALAVENAAIYAERPICNAKGRWYQLDPREDWTLEDYRTLRVAIYGALTNGIIGTSTAKVIESIDREVSDRFGVTLVEGRRSA